MDCWSNEIDAHMEASESKMDFILECYPEIESPYNVPHKLWSYLECPICHNDFNHERIKSGLMFCDNCNMSIDDIEKELKEEAEHQKTEDMDNFYKELFLGLKNC